MKDESIFSPGSGYTAVFLILLTIAASIMGLIFLKMTPFIIFFGLVLCVCLFSIAGFSIINPNESYVLLLFGEYKGTIKQNGFFWVNPFFVKKKVSLRARNQDSEALKVNDKLGNPVMIGIVLVWKVSNTYKSMFEVDNFAHFVDIQTESAIRKIAGHYPYDNLEESGSVVSLRSGVEEVNDELEKEISERLQIAGIEVIEARINYLAYASEIAGAMLRRQQATAIIAARKKIVEGAVGMVEMALDELSIKNVIELDDGQKAAMVSNLMVVLCADKDPSPVLNTGTLHQ
jgi:regulator of protease activity HflC (stomatin/prohibitin superfamily)